MKAKLYNVCSDYSLDFDTVLVDTNIDEIEDTLRASGCRMFRYLPDTHKPVTVKGYNEFKEIIYIANITR